MVNLIGLSLCFCIKDICLRRQPEGNILVIISATMFLSDAEGSWIDKAWNYYSSIYWNGLNEAEVRHLLANLPIIQPRAYDSRPPIVKGGHWLTSDPEDFSKWTLIGAKSIH